MPIRCDVLVVDDDDAVREALADLLINEGLSVRAVGSGAACLALLESCRPSLILLDVQMPQMTGPEVRERLRAHRVWTSIPVIFMTAGLAEIPEEMVRKPFLNIEPLLRRIRDVLEHDARAVPA